MPRLQFGLIFSVEMMNLEWQADAVRGNPSGRRPRDRNAGKEDVDFFQGGQGLWVSCFQSGGGEMGHGAGVHKCEEIDQEERKHQEQSRTDLSVRPNPAEALMDHEYGLNLEK